MTDEVFILFTLRSDCGPAAWDGRGLRARRDGSPGQGSREAAGRCRRSCPPGALPWEPPSLWAPAFEEPEKLTSVWWT